jgi:hypothetical protein
MKKIILMSILLLGASLCFAQNQVLRVEENQDYLYIGIDNRIQYSNSNVPQADIVATTNGAAGATITANDNNYDVRVKTTTKAGDFCSVIFKNKKTGALLKQMDFKVIRMPNPTACLSNKKSDGMIGSGEMKVQQSLFVFMGDRFIKDCCNVESFTLVYTGPGQNPVSLDNNGAIFEERALELIRLAKPRATYQFINVRGRCIGDTASRALNGLTFTVR